MTAQLSTTFWDLAFRCRRVDLNFAGPTKNPRHRPQPASTLPSPVRPVVLARNSREANCGRVEQRGHRGRQFNEVAASPSAPSARWGHVLPFA
jgi:hypothetical protein